MNTSPPMRESSAHYNAGIEAAAGLLASNAKAFRYALLFVSTDQGQARARLLELAAQADRDAADVLKLRKPC